MEVRREERCNEILAALDAVDDDHRFAPRRVGPHVAVAADDGALRAGRPARLTDLLGLVSSAPTERRDQLAAPIRVIPTVIDQNPCAHLRMPRDMIFHGWSMRLFQAWQHSATMSS